MRAHVFASIYVVLLLCVPTRLVVGPIGAPGTPANLFAILGLLWWIAALLGGLIDTKGITPMRFSVGIFTSSVVASYAAGHFHGWFQPADIHQRTDRLWQYASVRETTETISSAADRGLLALMGWLGIMLITAEGIRSWENLERLVNWTALATTAIATLGIIQYFTGINISSYIQIPGLQALVPYGDALSRSELNRIVATASHPIELGVALAAVLPLVVHKSLYSRTLLGWIPSVIVGVAALMSVSRSAIVVVAVAFLVLFFGWPLKRRIWALVLLPIGAIAGRAALPGLLGTIRALFTSFSDDPSVTGRTDDYAIAVELIMDHPLLGKGLYTFVPMVYRTLDNQILMFLLELGVIGTLTLGVLFVTALFMALRPWRYGQPERQKHLGLAVSAALIGIATSYVTFDALSFRQVAGLSFLFLGMCGAVGQLSLSQHLSGVSSSTLPDEDETAPEPAEGASPAP